MAKLASSGTGRDLRRREVLALGLGAGAALAAPSLGRSAHVLAPDKFARAEGTHFELDGKRFYVTGANNHYLPFASHAEVVRVLDAAVAMRANVVRTFLQPVIGSLDGTVATIWNWKSKAEASDLGVNGAYLLHWDSRAGRMAVNTGANGFEKIDFFVAEAARRGLRLIVAFLDFWPYTGGAQQMRAWYGSEDKNTFFFADERTRRDYRDWVRIVLTRVNTITGVRYKDDPTIFAWELMNEGNAEPLALLDSWQREMAAYVKSIDSTHMLASGHGNVLIRMPDLKIADLDFATWHGYPYYYNQSVAEFTAMIEQFCALGKAAGKPVLLEEFGWSRSNPGQVEAYREWLTAMRNNPDCPGWVVWRLVGLQDSGRYPVDNHRLAGFDVRDDNGPLWRALRADASGANAR